ncbi:MAG: hypothetical protein G01um101416_299 [Microgenomates group bacterium Gr01-1014_16]|nr:MAG: hypothetical protein G01um101416_299 [Microgenomates group bacterium Gr01-1014_16]
MNISKADDAMSLYREVVVVREAVEKLYKKIVRALPAREGTEEWWVKEDELAMEDYRAGRYTEHASIDDLVKAMEKKFGL